MEGKELLSSLSEEIKQKLAACKTQAEMERVLAEAGIEPMDDELLDAVAGGLLDLTSYCEANSYTRSYGMGASCRVMECILR